MRRKTHLIVGAAVGIPIAASLSPGLAVGCLWWGAVGGGFPDWLDLRSELRKPLRLRHRGISHSLLVWIATSALVWFVLNALESSSWWSFRLDSAAVIPWTISFTLGMASHLVLDALNRSGIQPFLPVSRITVRLLPGILRSRYDGYLDPVMRSAGLIAIAFAIVVYVTERW